LRGAIARRVVGKGWKVEEEGPTTSAYPLSARKSSGRRRALLAAQGRGQLGKEAPWPGPP
jgi:hypothetical protein